MQKLLTLICSIYMLFTPVAAFAQTTTLLPESTGDSACQGLITGGDTGLESAYTDGACMAEKIQTGKIHYRDIPWLIGYLIKFLLTVGWSLAVVMIIVGGYQYVLSGFGVNEKEKGKKTIIYALAGLVVATFAWFMVDTFIAFITS